MGVSGGGVLGLGEWWEMLIVMVVVVMAVR